MKQKSPEVEIPEGVFYDQIPGYNLFVEKKNPDTGVLKGVMIYDVSGGGDNTSIVLADSARIAFTKDNRYLYLRLFRGEQFENLRDQSSLDQNVPFRREKFADKEVLIPFDANFNRLDDQTMRKQYVGKNITELRQTIDSINVRVDSIGDQYSKSLLTSPIVGVNRQWSPKKHAVVPFKQVKMPAQKPDLDSMLLKLPEAELRQEFSMAHHQVESVKGNYEFKSESMKDDKKSLRRHEIELLKKFTLSVACLIMFFIGAPLGAIIRKGGLGTPLVVSVLLFLVYYIIDNTGYKMARDGRWPIWLGMWISTFILAPLGIYVTYKAMNDSAVFDKDAWLIKLRRLLGHKPQRNVPFKEVIINDISTEEAVSRLRSVMTAARQLLARSPRRMSYRKYWTRGYDMEALTALAETLEDTVTYLTDSRDILLVGKLMDYPVLRREWVYSPSSHRMLAKVFMWFVPFGLPLYLVGLRHQKELRGELTQAIAVSRQILAMLGEETDEDEPIEAPADDAGKNSSDKAATAESHEEEVVSGD